MQKEQIFNYYDPEGFLVTGGLEPTVCCPVCMTKVLYEHGFNYTCPNCGHQSQVLYPIMGDGELSDCMIDTITVSQTDTHLRITVKNVSISVSEVISYQYFHMKYVFNLVTGQCYKTATRDDNNVVVDSTFANITFKGESSKYIPYYAYLEKDVLVYVMNALRPNSRFTRPTLSLVCFAYRYPWLNDEQLFGFAREDMIGNTNKVLHKVLLSNIPANVSTYDFLRMLSSNLNLPNSKGTRKMLTSYKNVTWLYVLKLMGFNDINVKYRIIAVFDAMNTQYFNKVTAKCWTDFSIKFFNNLISIKGEVQTAILFTDIKQLYEDIINFNGSKYINVIEPKEAFDNYLNDLEKAVDIWTYLTNAGHVLASRNFRGVLEDIKERMVKEKTLFEHDSISITNYPKWVHNLQGVVNGYVFRLTTSTGEMMECGDIMDHCLGRKYSADAVKGTCYIILVFDKKGKYQAAIQIMPNGAVNQIKGYHNSSLKGNVALATKTWIEQHRNLYVDDCVDYQNLIQNILILS